MPQIDESLLMLDVRRYTVLSRGLGKGGNYLSAFYRDGRFGFYF